MSMMEVHVIANGALFQEAFNAIVTVMMPGQSTFKTAFRLAVLCSIFCAVIGYIKGRDLATLGKWFVLYFAVTVVLLGPKVSLQIIDSSDQAASYPVDNVPYGLAMPASLITSIAYGLESTMEEAFSMPDDQEYSKTGLLFGSRVFGLSAAFHMVDPDVRNDFNEYVKNCVIGDILINQKYSIKDLTNSSNIWSTITSNPSPVRGILFKDGSFKTCQEATSKIKTEIDNDVSNNSFSFFGTRIFGEQGAGAALKLQQALENSYNFYAGASSSAMKIMTQNVLMNGIRDGIVNYASETGATAALINLSSTQAMERTRMTWATSRNIATYVLPLMQTDILLMLLCMFPLIVLITVQPIFGIRVFKGYVYSLIWVESWAILFAVLNLAATFYLKHKTAALADGGLTLSNSNPLELEHSDVGNMAGYLMTCVPFLAIGIIKGMDTAFSNAAQYIGGMLHSTASAAATEAVTGNISLGNASYNNINANKYDTNSSFMHGMATSQMSNAALVTHTAGGKDVVNVQSAMSQLATSFNASSIISSSMSQQAETAMSAAIQHQHSYDHAISDASTHLENLAHTSGFQHGFGSGASLQENTSVARSAADMYNIVNDWATRHGTSFDQAFKGFTSFSQNIGGNVAFDKALGKKGLGIGGKLGGSFDHSRANDESTGISVGAGHNITNDEAKRFSADWNDIKQYSASQHIDASHSQSASQLSQVASELRKADNELQSYSSNLTQSESYRNMASYAEQNSNQVNTNFNQLFTEYVQSQVSPERAQLLLTNTDNPRLMAELEVYANRFSHSPEFIDRIEKMSVDGGGVEYLHQAGESHLSQAHNQINDQYRNNSKEIDKKAGAAGTDFDSNQYKQQQQRVYNEQKGVNMSIDERESALHANYNHAQEAVKQDIKEGNEKANYSAVWKGAFSEIKPDYAKGEDKK